MSTTILFHCRRIAGLADGHGQALRTRCRRTSRDVTFWLATWRCRRTICRHLLGSFIRRASILAAVLAPKRVSYCKRNPDTVRAPDFAFIAKQNLPANRSARRHFGRRARLGGRSSLTGRHDRAKLTRRSKNGSTAGCAAVWVVDPKLQTVTIYQSPTNVQVRTAGETLHGDPVVPGFSCASGRIVSVAELLCLCAIARATLLPRNGCDPWPIHSFANELIDSVRLSLVSGVGPLLRKALLERFGSPAAVLAAQKR